MPNGLSRTESAFTRWGILRIARSTGSDSIDCDILNNRTSFVTSDLANPVQSKSYSYDAANQLTAIRNTSPTGLLSSALVYDAKGSLIKKCDDGTVTGSATACTGAVVTASGFDALNRINQVSVKRQLFAELSEGMTALADTCQGK